MKRLFAFAFAFALAGCVDESSMMMTTQPQAVSYRKDVQPIWDKWCIGCHNFHTPHLVATMSAEHLAGTSWWKCDGGGTEKARFVVPGDPTKSYLLYKLTLENTNNYAAECGRAMPADRNGVDTPLVHLDPAAVATVRQWIEEGATFD